MKNPKAYPIVVDGIEYSYMYQDFGLYLKINLYQNGKRILSRKLPILVDKGFGTVQYLIRSINYYPRRIK